MFTIRSKRTFYGSYDDNLLLKRVIKACYTRMNELISSHLHIIFNGDIKRYHEKLKFNQR